MWLLPSRHRIGNLKRFFRACREVGIQTPGLVLVNAKEHGERQAEYAALDLPKGWSVLGVEVDCFHDAIRAAWPLVKDAPWIGLLQDDLVPGTPSWDVNLIKGLNGLNVVSANDGRGSGRMHGAIVWSGDLARHLGWLYPPGFKHLYGDDVWETLGRETGSWVLDQSVITQHNNETYGATADATGKSIAQHTEHDAARYKEWLANEKDQTVLAIRALKEKKGIKDIALNLQGFSLLIASPSIDNRFEGEYMQSLSDTMRGLQQMGVPCAWSVEKFNADVSLARAKIFSLFLRSPYTHMLMIDADMGWSFYAVLRLFAAKRDFVAVAGPKKSYPLRFAANHADENENIIPLRLNEQTGVCDVTEVGAAFALLTKQAAIKVARAFPELAYQGIGGEPEYGVFMPIIHRGRYKAEDFAFCRRLLAVGIQPAICPDVPLSHTGSHTFRGCLMDQFHTPPEALPKGVVPVTAPAPEAPPLAQAAE